MLQNHAAVQENHDRFLRRAVQGETVWGIRNAAGFQGCESNEDEERTVLLFWSDAAYARRAVSTAFPDCVPEEISLFDFLFRWLPGMEKDNFLAGTNYDANLFGIELEPLELREQLVDALPDPVRADYRKRLGDALGGQSQ